jgi:hypothetical protein
MRVFNLINQLVMDWACFIFIFFLSFLFFSFFFFGGGGGGGGGGGVVDECLAVAKSL